MQLSSLSLQSLSGMSHLSRFSGLSSISGMSRDRRDTLFMLFVTAWICLSHAAHLDLWVSLFTGGILLWRTVLTLRGARMPGRLLLGALLAACLIGIVMSEHQMLGRNAGVTLVIILLSMKTMELNTRRDAYALFFLGFFALLCNFFYLQTMATAGIILVGTLGLLALLINTHMPVGRPPLWHLLGKALWMALLGTPVMVVLFLFFPRLDPLWGMPSDSLLARSGLSSEMQVGGISRLAMDGSVAMRVHFDSPAPAQQDMYYRGPVLSRFDGIRWTATQGQRAAILTRATPVEVFDTPVYYQVTQVASHQPWMFVLDITPEFPPVPNYKTLLQSDMQWLVDRPIDNVLRYRVRSYTHYHWPATRRDPDVLQALQLPPGYNPRTVQWAADLRRSARYAHANNRTMAVAGLDFLRNGGYSYTLEPGRYGTHAADEFWFDQKQGFCEHIAQSYVVLMRALGVPARIVTGYQGGELNSFDGDWTVRQSDAHAWAEVWLEDIGWQRVDPTSAVAPQRTNAQMRLQVSPNLLTQALSAVGPDFINTSRAAWDVLISRWNDWVLNYSQGTQLNVLRWLGFSEPNWTDLVQTLVAVLSATSLLGAAWLYRSNLRTDPCLRLLASARKKLRRSGIDSNSSTTPRALANSLDLALIPSNPTDQSALEIRAIIDWLLRLEAWRYGPGATSDGRSGPTLGTLRQEFRKLHWPPHVPPRQN